jgi:two-component system sensor histidine kinase BarA
MLTKLFVKGTLASPGGAPSGRRWLRQQQVFLVGLLLLLALVWSAVFLQLRRDLREIEADAIQELSNLSLAFAESTASRLQSADQLIRLVRREVQLKGTSYKLKGSADFSGLFDESLMQIAIIGADGYLADSNLPFSRVDLRDREHFRVHQQAQNDQLYISRPLVGRVSKASSLQVTRRLDMADGRFGGVVVLSLASERFTSFYNSVDLGAQGVLALAGTDGWVRARRSTGDSQETHRNISQSATFQAALKAPVGTIWEISPIDQIERLYAFRRLEKFDLTAFVGRSREEIMSGVYQLRRIYVGVAGLFTLLLLGFSAALLRRMYLQSVLLEDLRLSQQQASVTHEMKSRFLASVSHELRTPLNGILGYAELLLEPASAGEIEEYAQVIHDSAQHLHQLVITMLDLAQVESGQMSANFADVNLQQILAEACGSHRATALARQLTLQVSIDDHCPLVISTDRGRLLQVLDSLIHNAVKFTDHGGVRVAAYCDSLTLTLEITDTGIGISVAQMGRLFARFEAATPELSHPAQGAGLGLALAKELTQLIGGVLFIGPTPALGTRVTIMLPLRSPETIDTKAKTS